MLEAVSADLPYVMHFDMFKEMATISTAAVGATIALAGSVLKTFDVGVWMAVIWFGLSALTCMTAQVTLATHLSQRRPALKRARLAASVAVMFMGMGMGGLVMSVLDNQHMLTFLHHKGR
jgi:hypothetical protein